MFFGSVDSAVELCWDAAYKASRMAPGHFHPDELNAKQAKTYFVLARMAYKYAKEYYMPQEVLDAIVEQYDELFMLVLECDDELSAALVSGTHKYLGGYSDENILKYRQLAGLIS